MKLHFEIKASRNRGGSFLSYLVIVPHVSETNVSVHGGVVMDRAVPEDLLDKAQDLVMSDLIDRASKWDSEVRHLFYAESEFDKVVENDTPWNDFEITLAGFHVPPRPHHRLFLSSLSGMAITEACEYHIFLEDMTRDLERMVQWMKEEKESLSRVIDEMACKGKLEHQHFVAAGHIWKVKGPDEDEWFRGVERLGRVQEF